MAEKKHIKFRPPQANPPAVSVIPVHEAPDTRVAQQITGLTAEELEFLQLCSSAPRPSDCTARQRRLFRSLEKRLLVKVIEYPCTDGPRWALSTSGELDVEVATTLTGYKTDRIAPATLLAFPTRQGGAR